MSNEKVGLKVVRLSTSARLPTKATDGSACMDLYAAETKELRSGKSVVIQTGLAFEVPPGYAMFVFSRSGMGFNQDIRLANCVGVVDSDYRGGVKVKLTSDKAIYEAEVTEIEEGMRIAQFMLLPVPDIELQVLSDPGELSETERGYGGYGSSGA